MFKSNKNAIILASEAFGTLEGKTANDLVIYGGKYKISAIIDEAKAGKDAGEVLGIGAKNIPIVKNLKEALKYKPTALIIGIAPPGGGLPDEWKIVVKEAIANGLDIVSGLHFFFGDHQEFSDLAKKHGVNLIDIRKPPKNPKILAELVDATMPVVAILSTDAATGKNIVMIELAREAEKRGLEVGFVATGQTMIMIKADTGAAIDAIPGDFMSGTVGQMTVEVAKLRKDLILVEGQASLSHPTYGVESLAILYGSQPDAVVLVHDPFRVMREGFPKLKVPSLLEEIRMIETMCPKAQVIGIALLALGSASYTGDYKSDDEVIAAIARVEAKTSLPANDAWRFGVTNLFDALVKHCEKINKPLKKESK